MRGAALVPGQRAKYVTVTMSDSDFWRLERVAERLKSSRSEAVRMVVRYLERAL